MITEISETRKKLKTVRLLRWNLAKDTAWHLNILCWCSTPLSKCECSCVTESPGEDFSSSVMLLCVLCKDSFQSAWDLMVHVQAAHMMNIYELGLPKSETSNKCEQTSHQPSPATSPCPYPIHDKDVVSTTVTAAAVRVCKKIATKFWTWIKG